MKENFSKDFKRSSANKFALFYRNWSFFAISNSQTFVSMLSHENPVHSHTLYSFKTHFSINPSTPSSSKQSLSFRFFHQTPEILSYFPSEIINTCTCTIVGIFPDPFIALRESRPLCHFCTWYFRYWILLSPERRKTRRILQLCVWNKETYILGFQPDLAQLRNHSLWLH